VKQSQHADLSAERVPNVLDDSDLYYARALVASAAGEWAKRRPTDAKAKAK